MLLEILTFKPYSNQDSFRPEDAVRRFIISYRLADEMITVYEPPVRNSGVIGGKFLERTRVSKPGSRTDAPEYYGPQDFYINATIEIFNHRFIITNADAYVLKYMEEHAHQFPGIENYCTKKSFKPDCLTMFGWICFQSNICLGVCVCVWNNRIITSQQQ